MAEQLKLSLMLRDYHRTQPLIRGEVSVDGITLLHCAPISGEVCLRPVYEEFDIAEMSLSWYIMARCQGEPVLALPIFPARLFIQPYIFCGVNSRIESPKDLRGKKVGIEQYRLTVGLWARGILQEHYGVIPQDMTWVTSEPEGAGFTKPEKVHILEEHGDVEALLLDGKIDALIAPNAPVSFRRGDPRIRRLFSDPRAAVVEYFTKTQIFPTTHTVVVRESLLEEYPTIGRKIAAAFLESDRICREAYAYPKRLALPTAVLILEEEEKAFGKEPWMDGLVPNRTVLEKFVQYAEEQGYISYRPAISDLFLAMKD